MNFDDFFKNYPMYKNRLIFSKSFIYEHTDFAKSINDIKTLVDWCKLKSIPLNQSLTERELTKLMYHIKGTILSESALINTLKSYTGKPEDLITSTVVHQEPVKKKEPVKQTLSLKEQIALEVKQIILNEAPKKLPKDKTSGKVSDGDIDNFDGLGNDLPDDMPEDEPPVEDTPPEGEEDPKAADDEGLPPEDGAEDTPPEDGEDKKEIENDTELDMGDEDADMPEDPSEKYQNDDVKAFEDDDGADTDPNDGEPEDTPAEGEEDPTATDDEGLPPEDGAETTTPAEGEEDPEATDDEGLPPEDGMGDKDNMGDDELDSDYEDEEDGKPLTKQQMKKTELLDKYEDILEVIDNALGTLTSGNIKRLANTDTDVETLKYIKIRINKMKDDINDSIQNEFLSKPIQDLEAKYIENKISLTNFIELLLNISKNSGENK